MKRPPRKLSFSKKVQYAFETAAAYAVYGFFRLLPVEAASSLGGFILRTLGPGMKSSRKAVRNLDRAFPEKSAAEKRKILIGMWDNLGRVVGEYPHLRRMRASIEIVGAENLDAARDSGRASIFFGGHLANWEACVLSAKNRGLPVRLIYRRPNNPWVDGLLRHARNAGAAAHIAKGMDGAREIVSALKGGAAIAMLMDQKLNEGLPVPFFGRPAMTAPAIAQFALKFRCPVYPARAERLGGSRIRVTVLPPLDIRETGDKEADIFKILTDINMLLESWIRERPEQWLWIHRRWPD